MKKGNKYDLKVSSCKSSFLVIFLLLLNYLVTLIKDLKNKHLLFKLYFFI